MPQCLNLPWSIGWVPLEKKQLLVHPTIVFLLDHQFHSCSSWNATQIRLTVSSFPFASQVTTNQASRQRLLLPQQYQSSTGVEECELCMHSRCLHAPNVSKTPVCLHPTHAWPGQRIFGVMGCSRTRLQTPGFFEQHALAYPSSSTSACHLPISSRRLPRCPSSGIGWFRAPGRKNHIPTKSSSRNQWWLTSMQQSLARGCCLLCSHHGDTRASEVLELEGEKNSFMTYDHAMRPRTDLIFWHKMYMANLKSLIWHLLFVIKDALILQIFSLPFSSFFASGTSFGTSKPGWPARMGVRHNSQSPVPNFQ